MDNETKLNLMKKRVIGSFKWQEDIIIPFSKEFGCTTEDLEDLFMDFSAGCLLRFLSKMVK